MARTYYNVKRGMVFWYEPPKSETRTSVQKGMRPWLVVSNDLGNISSPTCNVVPMTTEDKTPIPTHVKVWVNGQLNTIMCEQVTTIDQNSVRDYLCFLTDDTMSKVDEALRVQFNIQPTIEYADYNVDNLVHKLEDLIGNIIKDKIESQNKATVPYKDLEDSALRLGQMIEDLVGSRSTENSEVKLEQSNKACDVVSTEPKIPSTQSINKTRKWKWTTELRCQYLRDCDELSPEQVREKYGFSSIGTVFSTKYNCRNILKDLGVDYKYEETTRR